MTIDLGAGGSSLFKVGRSCRKDYLLLSFSIWNNTFLKFKTAVSRVSDWKDVEL